MKKAEVKKPFIKMVEDVVCNQNFSKNKTDEWFSYKKTTNYGFVEITPVIWNHVDLYYIAFFLHIRISQIQDILNPYMDISRESLSPTLVANITNFGYEDYRLKVETPEELESALSMLKSVLENEGMQFFEKFKTVDDLDKEFNRENRPRDLYGSDRNRHLIGLTSAVLNGNKQARYWENYYREKLRNVIEHVRTQYEALVLHLNEHYTW